MTALQVTFNGQNLTFAPGAIVRVGRSSENDVVVNDPTVSRRHAQLAWEASGWVWQNSGQAPTFLAGQPVAQFAVGQQVDVNLASPQGPALRLATTAEFGAGGPGGTELAAGAGVAGQTNVAAPPGYAAAAAPPGQQNVPQAQDYAARHGYAQQGYQGAPAQQQGAPQQGFPGAAPAQGYPGQPGAAPPGVPGYPGYQAGAGYPPGAPDYAGGPAVPAQPGIPLSHLDQGSFFETLIPVKSWLHDRGWRQGIRLLIIPYALLPLIFLQIFSTSTSLTTPGWAYSLYVAPLWLLTFWYLIRPPMVGKLEVIIAAGIIVWTVIWINIVTININVSYGKINTFPGALIVGFNEETAKALPVLIAAILVLKIRKQKLDPRTWLLMGTVAGLTFGIVEQAFYTKIAIIQVAAAHAVNQADIGVLSFADRVFVDGFQHAVWAGVSGFFVGMAINYRRRRIPLLLLGISIPALLHALNDYAASTFSTLWILVLIQAVSLLLFLGYTLSAASIERRVRRNPNFRGQSIMMERFSEPEQAASP
ncbi:MAG TPA: PrsW family glutamic-type intramembrane protease [Streptosporangiaceae bacterium]|nr:PrsW family glutamic-type intramembrane protease [Streptosporangiaceae bacterium]